MTVTEITNKTHGCRETIDCCVLVPSCLSSTGEKYTNFKPVDKCLAPIVNLLNQLGVLTASCCCGHGVSSGSIILHDGTCIAIPEGLCERRKVKLATLRWYEGSKGALIASSQHWEHGGVALPYRIEFAGENWTATFEGSELYSGLLSDALQSCEDNEGNAEVDAIEEAKVQCGS